LIVLVHAPDPAAVPVAGLTATPDGPTALGETTNFVAGVSAGSNVGYAWDFGDGSSGVGPAPSHTYAQPGSYLVRVTASNSVSQASAELQVVVEPASPGQVTHRLYLPAVER
jgi:PKD repeat protein